MQKYISLVTEFTGSKRAVTAVEYGIMAALIATALVTIIGTFTSGLSTAFTAIAGHLKTGT